jgi:hypothetical protein
LPLSLRLRSRAPRSFATVMALSNSEIAPSMRVISNARPIIRNDPGEIAEGVYTVVADKAVEVWDLQGRLLGTEVLRPGDGADAVARKILREKSGKRNSFYDAIVYPRWAI